MQWLATLWVQRTCLLIGHDPGPTEGRGRRVVLKCGRCGCLSPGWDLGPGPVPRFDGDPSRHRLAWFGVDWGTSPDQTVVTIQDADGLVFIGNPDDAAVILAGMDTDGRVH